MSPKKIKEIRQAFGMSQQEFAAALGLETKGHVSRLESGKRPPTGPLLKLLERLAREAGVDLEESP